MVSDSEAVSSELRLCLVLDVPQPILNQSYSHTISLLGNHAQTLHHLFGSGDSQSYGDDNGGDWEEFQSQPLPYTCQILDILGILNQSVKVTPDTFTETFSHVSHPGCGVLRI